MSLLDAASPGAHDASADPDTAVAGAAVAGAARDKPGSLLPVLRVIPESAYDNPTWKGLAYFGRDMAIYLAALVGLFLFDNIFIVLALWLVAAIVVSGLFVIGHDAAHEALFKGKRLNSIVGHVSMLPSWHVYEGWVLGHNRVHHKFTVRQGFDFVWHPYTVDQYAEMTSFHRLRHRLEWSWMGAGAYYIREIWWHKMMVGKPPARWVKGIRRDRWIILAWMIATMAPLVVVGFGRAGVVGALWLPFKMFVVPFVAFSFVIGSFVHVHHIQPTIRWWSGREWNKYRGQVEGTTILRMAPGFNFFFHWIMVHVPHHVDVRIPMYNLEEAAIAIQAAFPDDVHDETMRFRDFIANTKLCKLYDFEAGHWMTYGEGMAAYEAKQLAASVAA